MSDSESHMVAIDQHEWCVLISLNVPAKKGDKIDVACSQLRRQTATSSQFVLAFILIGYGTAVWRSLKQS